MYCKLLLSDGAITVYKLMRAVQLPGMSGHVDCDVI